MVTVSGTALGRKRPLFADFSIELPPAPRGDGDGDGPTLRDLITRVVQAEVTAFHERQAERRLVHALTARQIQDGADRGKIDSGGRDLKQTVDTDAAVGAALQAFEDGLYLVVVDGIEHRNLDQEVHPQADSRVAFIRLTLLAGG